MDDNLKNFEDRIEVTGFLVHQRHILDSAAKDLFARQVHLDIYRNSILGQRMQRACSPGASHRDNSVQLHETLSHDSFLHRNQRRTTDCSVSNLNRPWKFV